MEYAPIYAPFVGALGIVAAISLSCKSLHAHAPSTMHHVMCARGIGFGASYGTAKSGVGILTMGVMRPDLAMKSLIPIIMAGVLAIYGLIVAVMLNQKCKHECVRSSSMCVHIASGN